MREQERRTEVTVSGSAEFGCDSTAYGPAAPAPRHASVAPRILAQQRRTAESGSSVVDTSPRWRCVVTDASDVPLLWRPSGRPAVAL